MPCDDVCTIQDLVIEWIDGRVFAIAENAWGGPVQEPGKCLQSLAALFLEEDRFVGPVWRDEIGGWLQLIVGVEERAAQPD